jgi:hypothetical protein
LFIGDSLTCGLALERSDGGQPIPQGVLDAFPSRAVSILRERNSNPLSLEVVAYPGISLTRLGRPKDDDSAASSENLGMTDKFFHVSPSVYLELLKLYYLHRQLHGILLRGRRVEAPDLYALRSVKVFVRHSTIVLLTTLRHK